MSAQKPDTIKRLESGESWREVMASYNIGLSTIYAIKKQKDQLWSCMASSENVKDLFKWQTLVQLNKICIISAVEQDMYKEMHRWNTPLISCAAQV